MAAFEPKPRSVCKKSKKKSSKNMRASLTHCLRHFPLSGLATITLCWSLIPVELPRTKAKWVVKKRTDSVNMYIHAQEVRANAQARIKIDQSKKLASIYRFSLREVEYI